MSDATSANVNPLDELFQQSMAYRSGAEYREVLDFVSRFRSLGPYNAALVQIQRPGARFALRAPEWARKYNRTVTRDARPLMVLKHFGPIDFVFDVSDTQGDPLPDGLLNPFGATGDVTSTGVREFADRLIAVGVRCTFAHNGSELAGQITRLADPEIINRGGSKPYTIAFELELNAQHSPATTLATIAHELGHMYCGHLGGMENPRVPDRSELDELSMEFEAECVSWLLCRRLDITVPSARYLSGYLDKPFTIPQRSEHRILRATGRIEELVKGGLETLGTSLRSPELTLFRAGA